MWDRKYLRHCECIQHDPMHQPGAPSTLKQNGTSSFGQTIFVCKLCSLLWCSWLYCGHLNVQLHILPSYNQITVLQVLHSSAHARIYYTICWCNWREEHDRRNWSNMKYSLRNCILPWCCYVSSVLVTNYWKLCWCDQSLLLQLDCRFSILLSISKVKRRTCKAK